MKTNFGVTTIDKEADEYSDKDFEQMLVKAKAKGSFMVFTDFINNPIDQMVKEELYDEWLMNCNINLNNQATDDGLGLYGIQYTKPITKAVIVGGSPQELPTDNQFNRLKDLGYTI